jgi:exodeoxyribonuclease-3
MKRKPLQINSGIWGRIIIKGVLINSSRGLTMKKMISWNVNGIRACVKKGFLDYFEEVDADIFCVQETRVQEGQIDLELRGYHQYWSYAEKKGYSGTAIFTKQEPISVLYGLGVEEHDDEGRVTTLEFEDFYATTVYTPNSQPGLARLDYRMQWDDCFREYINELDKKKPVIICGDLNVAHKEIDLKDPEVFRGSAGFSDEERDKFTRFLESGFIDTYRYFYPDKEEAYTWWSYKRRARKYNAGWRIDYFCVSERLKDRLVDADIHADILGSDHCPVELVIK